MFLLCNDWIGNNYNQGTSLNFCGILKKAVEIDLIWWNIKRNMFSLLKHVILRNSNYCRHNISIAGYVFYNITIIVLSLRVHLCRKAAYIVLNMNLLYQLHAYICIHFLFCWILKQKFKKMFFFLVQCKWLSF